MSTLAPAGFGPATIFGLRVVTNALAVTTRYTVLKHPTRKRRRRWYVGKVTEPTMYSVQLGHEKVIVAHPAIYDKLVKAVQNDYRV